MRKTMKTVSIIFAFILMVFASTACNHHIEYGSLKGSTYKMTALVMGGITGTLNETSFKITSSEGNVVVTENNGSYTATVNGVPLTGLKARMMELMYKDMEPKLHSLTMSFESDNTLSITSSEGEMNGTYSFDEDSVSMTVNGFAETGGTSDKWQTFTINIHDEEEITGLWDSYRSFIQMFDVFARDVYHDKLEEIIEEVKSHRGIIEDDELKPTEVEEIVTKSKAMFKRVMGENIPLNPQKMIMTRI